MLLALAVACTPDEPPDGAGEELPWADCGGGVECATLPGSGLTAARRLADRPDARWAVIASGGPGGSSIELLRGMLGWGEYDPDWWYGTNWLALDNHGVGTDQVACVDGAWFDDVRGRDPLPATADDEDALLASAAEFRDGCVADRGEDGLASFGTPTYADDLDELRAAVGASELDLLGFSYGTWIGAVYAARYPDRVGRFVLDGVVGPDVTREVFLRAQSAGFATALDRFFARCDADSECPAAPGSAQRYDDLLDTLRAAPLPTDDGRALTLNDLRWAAASAMYGPDDAAFADALASADAGDGLPMLQLADDGWGRDDAGGYDPTYQGYWAIGCLDVPWPADWTEDDVWGFAAEMDAEHPRIGSGMATGELNCLDWPVSAPPVDVATSAPPMLLVSGRYDPATPLDSGERLQAALGNGSPLLEYDGDGHVALFTDGTACVYAAERAFLLDGEPPSGACP